MVDKPIPPSLQASILALLIVNKRYGAVVAGQVETKHFDETHREIAEGVLRYWREYNKPPGQEHIDDIFATELQSKSSNRVRRLLLDLLGLSVGLNAEYVANRTAEFIEGQYIRNFLIQASERFQQGGDEVTSDIRDMMSSTLKDRPIGLSAGTFLGEANKLRFLDSRSTTLVPLGIKELDSIGIGPVQKELLLYIAPKGSGKTWFCVHVGRQGLIHRERVLHISLEYGEEGLMHRYMQSLFVAGKGPEYVRTILEGDELDRLSGFKTNRKRKTHIDLTANNARVLFRRKLKSWGLRLNRIVLKRFPTGQLTIGQLEAYLDFLELKHNFVPTILIVDYPDLMRIDSRNYRIDLGRVFEQLRGVCVDRNLALIAPTQGQRSSLGAKHVDSTHASEDIRKVNAADQVLTYSQTKDEKRLGLARLYVAHARDTADGSSVILSQAYAVGQYAMDSKYINNVYWEVLKAKTGSESDEE